MVTGGDGTKCGEAGAGSSVASDGNPLVLTEREAMFRTTMEAAQVGIFVLHDRSFRLQRG